MIEESAVGMIIMLLIAIPLGCLLFSLLIKLLDKLLGDRDNWNRGDSC